jgi:hypothetical protein
MFQVPGLHGDFVFYSLPFCLVASLPCLLSLLPLIASPEMKPFINSIIFINISTISQAAAQKTTLSTRQLVNFNAHVCPNKQMG